jgi:peptidoglycan/xylan/chitin deacetylase (PgdA/CDA1 family)
LNSTLKSLSAPALYRLAQLGGISVDRARALKVMRVVMIHGVGTVHCSLRAFEDQIAFIKKNFKIVPLETICQRLESGMAESEGEVALTFDDGLRNNFFNAYPILKRYGAPATFFVCPGLIDNSRWLWNHEVRARLQSMPGRAMEELGRSFGLDRADIDSTVEWMKTLPMASRGYIEDSIRLGTPDFTATPEQHSLYDLMTWSELKQMDPGLISIGAHSLTHPILTSLSPAQQVHEISESQRLLERKLNRPIHSFCYPNGANNAAVVQCVRQNFKLAVTAVPGFVVATTDAHLIPRVSIAPGVSLLAWRMHRPGA